jgi:hypothetical protein
VDTVAGCRLGDGEPNGLATVVAVKRRCGGERMIIDVVMVKSFSITRTVADD